MVINMTDNQKILFLMKKITKILAVFLFLIMGKALSLPTEAMANNLQITNFEVSSVDETGNKIIFTADLNWENSWKSTINQDAVWVFLKYSLDGGATWKHGSMGASGTNPNGFSAPSGFSIMVPSDEKGFFIYRSGISSGNSSADSTLFAWDYGQDGLTDEQAMASNTINKIFGIEMVYVPLGSFFAGDNNSSSDFRFMQGSADTEPWYIQNENAITTTNTAADGFYYTSTGETGESSTGSVFLVPTSFPKGYEDFYVMKYELTENQWVNFFNTLSSEEKVNRDITSSAKGGKNSDGVVNRNTISWDSSNVQSDATTLRPNRPVSYISWPDLLAYADWAALRPVSELEYEKAVRGKDIQPVANEYAWGTASYNDAQAAEIYPDTDEGGTEQIYDGSANLNKNNLGWASGDGRVGGIAQSQAGPLRVGIFAESSSSRSTSGSSYYGAMEMSGNLYEMVVTLGRQEGRQFLGSHGDGRLSTVSGYEGNATVLDWPGINTTDASRGVTGTIGSGYRGGDFQSPATKHYQVSNRTYATKDPDSGGYNQRYDASLGIFQGGRLGRTAP